MSFNFNLQSIQQSLQKTTKSLSDSLQQNLNSLPSAEKVTSSLQSNLNNLGKEVSNLKPILQRTRRSLQEKLGSTSDISELPQEYKDLEKQTDALKNFYKKLLQVTRQYEIESYDYPPNLKESLNDYTKILNQKINEAVLLRTTKDKYPKTFAHQFSRVLDEVKKALLGDGEQTAETKTDSSLTKAVQFASNSEFKLGDERLEQDKLVTSEFNNKIRNILKTQFSRADRLRRKVETARLNFDTVRAEIKEIKKGDETVEVPDAKSKQLEAAEDELVNATESAVEAMKELIKTEEPVNLITVLTKIQLNYHKSATEELSELAEELGVLNVAGEDDVQETES
ncbi:hypothetical protein HII12_001791 [Brettanomyces bruxellensis]|uniref:BAR domain-containing protein n=1 Tax=Dekkera bruxellensis TaxID=5007 RepID=A0A8H6BK36_DEKBR|nr:hypothetical protein HII12_001791 [Brettanomyces bruxellensis]